MEPPPVVRVAGQTLHLLPEKAAYWVEARTLLVADPHFGKGAAFRAAGVPVPAGTTAENLRRLDAALDREAATRIIFLGDFLHAREGRAQGTFDAIAEWRQRRAELELLLVRGNHDRRAGDPPAGLGIACVDEPLLLAPFSLAHEPGRSTAGYELAGHLHPAVRLLGRGRQRKNLPCFWFGGRAAVLPAFGDFTGSAIVDPLPGDRIFVVADGEVLEIE